MKSVFEFSDYKTYLLEVERQRSTLQRGFRSRLAEELGCQNAYVSQVLNNDAHFSLEQGLKVASFLGLKDLEQKGFLTMIEFARAGTKELRAYFREQLDQYEEKNLSLKDRVPGARAISPEAQSQFYSHWMYAAIHMLTTLPEYRDLASIIKALRLPEDTARAAILFLISCGLLEEKGGRFLPGSTQLHLSKESPLIRQHHTNWRMAAIDSLMRIERNDIHYSTVSTLSAADAEKIKARMVEVIRDYVATVQASPEQTMYTFNLDFFCLVKSS